MVGLNMKVQSTAAIVATGGNGNGGNDGASGGGSGGGIILHGTTVRIDGVLVATGGNGGTGGCCGDGGGGSGGRIEVQYKAFSSRGTMVTVVAGGTSGTSGPDAHGGLSADPTGGAGIVSFTHIDASLLSIGPSRSVAKGATVSVATKLTDGGTGSGIAKASVGLYRHLATGGPWKLAATKMTSAGGQAVASVKVTASAQYEWRFAGALVHDPGNSSIQSLLVKK